MEAIVDYFATIPSSHRGAILVGGLAFFFILEHAIPLFSLTYDRSRHTWRNIFFTITTILVNFLMAFIVIRTSMWTQEASFGILNWLHANIWVEAILGLMILDLIAAYFSHYLEHKVWFLWQLHLVHHTDQNVDVTTANRHHPGESVYRFLFTTLAVLVAGAPIWLVFLYQSMSALLSQFNHSNIKLPVAIDRILKLIICTPDMHRVHHHYRQPYSDSNYGNIFSFWDRIFGSYTVVDNRKLVYGVDTYMSKEEAENITTLLKIPFQEYRTPISYEKAEKL